MHYKITDNPDIKVGDTVEMEDGSVHEAVENKEEVCNKCSLLKYPCHNPCVHYYLMFKLINPASPYNQAIADIMALDIPKKYKTMIQKLVK